MPRLHFEFGAEDGSGSIGRPQLGLPRLFGMKIRAASSDNTPIEASRCEMSFH